MLPVRALAGYSRLSILRALSPLQLMLVWSLTEETGLPIPPFWNPLFEFELFSGKTPGDFPILDRPGIGIGKSESPASRFGRERESGPFNIGVPALGISWSVDPARGPIKYLRCGPAGGSSPLLVTGGGLVYFKMAQ